MSDFQIDDFRADEGSEPVQIEATAPTASVSVVPTEINGRGVAEVWLIPSAAAALPTRESSGWPVAAWIRCNDAIR